MNFCYELEVLKMSEEKDKITRLIYQRYKKRKQDILVFSPQFLICTSWTFRSLCIQFLLKIKILSYSDFNNASSSLRSYKGILSSLLYLTV